MRKRTRLVAFLSGLLLVVLPGCSVFRAQVGLGFGAGADVQVLGFQHAGLLLGGFHEWGPNYGRDTYSYTSYLMLALLHSTDMRFDPPELGGPARAPIHHGCVGLLPGPLGMLSNEPMEGWAFEIGLALGFIELRFGVNPLAPVYVEEAPPPPPRPTQPAQGQGPVASGQGGQGQDGQRASRAHGDGGAQDGASSTSAPTGSGQGRPVDAYGSRGTEQAGSGSQGTFCATCGARMELCGCRR